MTKTSSIWRNLECLVSVSTEATKHQAKEELPLHLPPTSSFTGRYILTATIELGSLERTFNGFSYRSFIGDGVVALRGVCCPHRQSCYYAHHFIYTWENNSDYAFLVCLCDVDEVNTHRKASFISKAKELKQDVLSNKTKVSIIGSENNVAFFYTNF